MPTYNYKCENGHDKDIFHSMDEAPRMYCHCGKPLKKGFSSPVITFKGQGFYSTDKKK
jgi:putative FmdB family regulatory protein